MYELVILSEEWLNSPGSPKKFDALSDILNKSYSKPMARFGIVQSKRIEAPSKLRKSLGLENKEAFIMLLLGSREVFSQIEEETGWKRVFDPAVWPLSGSENSDIPRQYRSYFEELTLATKIKLTVPKSGEDLEDDVPNRILASTGYKFVGVRDSAKIYELTAVTSFLAQMGARILQYANDAYLSDSGCPYLSLQNCKKVILRAVVIKEHLLIPYYERCGFRLTGEPDVLFVPTNDPNAEKLVASRDFHWTNMEMELPVA